MGYINFIDVENRLFQCYGVHDCVMAVTNVKASGESGKLT